MTKFDLLFKSKYLVGMLWVENDSSKLKESLYVSLLSKKKKKYQIKKNK